MGTELMYDASVLRSDTPEQQGVCQPPVFPAENDCVQKAMKNGLSVIQI